MKATPLLALLCALSAQAESPPLDPWTESAWGDVMFGLVRGKVARLHATQQLFDVHSGAPGALSTREVRIEFELPDGRVARLAVNEERRSESGSRRSFRYVYEGAALHRIEEDGYAAPAVTRRYDAAGRPVEHVERQGAVVARTTWRYDAAGRLIERLVDSGTGSRSKETRRYRRDGTLERLDVDSGAMAGKRVDFDASERPLRIRVNDLGSRSDTKVSYPGPLEAVHETKGFALSRGGGPYAYTNRYRVRAPAELRGVEAPELPTMRRHVRGALDDAVQTDYDASGRVLLEHRLDARGEVLCTARIAYHPSGPPVSIRHERVRSDARCDGNDIDNEVKADERGHWSEQRMWLLRADGQRRLMSIQIRRIEYAP